MTKPDLIQHFSTAWTPQKLVKWTRENGALFETFCGLDEPAMQLLPSLPDGYIYTDKSTVVLRGKNIEPHRDSDVGITPKGYRFWGGVFGLLSGADSITLQVGDASIRMNQGDWVMFDDSILHGVYSDKVWYGLAVQIAKKK